MFDNDVMTWTHNIDGGLQIPDTPDEIPEGFFSSSDVRYQDTKLLNAIEGHDNVEVLRLLNSNEDPNATCHISLASACHIAVLSNNSEALRLLLEHGAERGRRDVCGRTPLHLAAWRGNPLNIVLLLDLPEDFLNQMAQWSIDAAVTIAKRNSQNIPLVDMPCMADEPVRLPHSWPDTAQYNYSRYFAKTPPLPTYWTALHAACARARPCSVRLLLVAGADALAEDQLGRTALDVTAASFYMGRKIAVQKFREVINILIEAGVPFKNDLFGHNTPLHTAVELQDPATIELMKEMLAAGASTSILNDQGFNPMQICVKHRLLDHLQVLVDYGDITAKDSKGHTILHTAVLAEWLEGVSLVCNAGAKVLERANTGESALYLAVELGNADILAIMLNSIHSRDINYHVTNNETVLFTAVYKNHIECVKLLLDHGVSPAITNMTYKNVFQAAASQGLFEMLHVLVDYARDNSTRLINSENHDGYTPISYAVMNNHVDCVRLLLSKNASVHIKSKSKEFTTVLHLAAAGNHVEIAKLIIEHDRTTIDSFDGLGKQPLHQAAYHGSRDVIALLLRNGGDLSMPVTDDSKMKTTAIDTLMNNLTKPTEFMENILDESITCGEDLETATVEYNILTPNVTDMRQMRVIKALLNTGNRQGQRSLLLHPVVESFLYLKWSALVPFFYVILILYGCYVISLNVYLVSVFIYIDKYIEKHKPLPNIFNPVVWRYFVVVTTTLIALQEVMHMKLRTKSYFLRLETWVKWAAIGPSIFLPWLATWDMPKIPEWIRLIATVTILMSWLEMMFLLSRFPTWGFYVLMFGKVTSKMVKIFVIFLFLIIGFSFSFLIQFRSKPPFENPLAAIVKTIVMLSAEFDYEDSFNKKTAKELTASLTTLRIIFVVFLVLASIVLLNLMIGIAVNDINHLQKVGNIRKLEKQVEFLTSLEKNVYFDFINKLPRVFSNYLNINKLLSKSIVVTQNKFPNNIDLPSHIKNACFEKAQAKAKLIQVQDNYDTFRVKIDQLHSAIVKDRQTGLAKSKVINKNIAISDYNGDVLDKITTSMENMASEMAVLRKILLDFRTNAGNSTYTQTRGKERGNAVYTPSKSKLMPCNIHETQL